MKKTLIHTFDTLSFNKKIKLSILFIGSVSLLVLLIINAIFGVFFTRQIYESNHDKITFASANLYEHFEAIETFSYKLIGNDPLQKSLLQANQANTTADTIKLKQEMQLLINALVLDEKDLRSVFLLNADQENQVNFMADSSHLLTDLSADTIVSTLPDRPSKGQWFFSENFSRAIYARKIFNTKHLALDYLGTIILTVDTSFIERILNERKPPTSSELFILQYRDAYYSNSKLAPEVFQAYIELINKPEVPTASYRVARFEGEKYFIVENHSTDQAFTFYSLQPNKDVLKKITHIELVIILTSLSLFIGIMALINQYVSSLISPINKLATNMTNFQQTKDFSQLKTIAPLKSGDEIGVLYQSYQTMIEEIDQLISQNYQAKILAQEIEFKALQAQLDPHFLYNTLDSINWLALNKEETEISQMVTSLAFLFKKKIDNSSTTTTIEDELDLIDAYIAIQSIRFQHRFTFVPVILVDDLSRVIPKLIIQPLIENSFKYAVEKMAAPCLIQLKVFERDGQLIISVSDNGPGFSDHHLDLEANHGIGLKNIKARLRVKYQLAQPLTIRSRPFEQTEVTLTIPLNERPDSYEKTISSRR